MEFNARDFGVQRFSFGELEFNASALENWSPTLQLLEKENNLTFGENNALFIYTTGSRHQPLPTHFRNRSFPFD
ncbi:MAG: hypothetical protein KAI83_04665 [Thiomargarita sp.]|nr:hypothetical protein [Thiomargarita sp.]